MRSHLRAVARHLTLDVVSLSQRLASQLDFKQARPAIQIVLLHHVKPSEEATFERLIKWLLETRQLVSYSDAIRQLTGEAPCSRNSVAISFDDGLADNLRAAQIMSQWGVSGCFFVCPSIIEERNAKKIKAFCRDRLLFKQSSDFMNWDDLIHLRDSGHEIGNHSLSHYYMNKLSDTQFDEEVAESRDQIVRKLGSADHFAWPYGRFFHFRESQVRRVLELGHRSCASGERGSHQPYNEQTASLTAINGTGFQFCIRRESVNMSWPLRHSKFFLNRSLSAPIEAQDFWRSA